jgi:hypothetical protein
VLTTDEGARGRDRPGAGFANHPRIKRKESELLSTSKEQVEVVATTAEKKAYLREWALAQSKGDPANLPLVREARIEVRQHFGDSPGSGLGTDIIGQVLRELKDELTKKRLRDEMTGGGVVGAEMPVDDSSRWATKLATIARIMMEEGYETVTINRAGEPVEMKKFSKDG